MKSMMFMKREVSGGRGSSRRGTPNSEDAGDIVLEWSVIGHRLWAIVG